MTIGSIKLFKKDNSDKILLGNPSYSFWKKLYHRHSNFSIQNILLRDDSFSIFEDKDSYFKFRIERNADLVSNIFLVVNLPDIYSNFGNSQEFSWNRYLGCSILKSAKLYFDNRCIETIDGDFLKIYDHF